MFAREIALNEFLLAYFDKVVADIPAAGFLQRGAGGGHPPLWIVGHLAAVAEMATQLAGGEEPLHPEWLQAFGPRSNDEIVNPEQYDRETLLAAVRQGYRRLQQMVEQMSPESIARPHPLPILKGTPIATVGDLLAHVLTSHFALHLGQLSAWRRAAGHAPLL